MKDFWQSSHSKEVEQLGFQIKNEIQDKIARRESLPLRACHFREIGKQEGFLFDDVKPMEASRLCGL